MAQRDLASGFIRRSKFAAAMPQSDGFRESYAGVTEALADPTRWSQVQPLIGTSERASGRINTLRIMMPSPDFAVELAGLEKMLRDGWPSYYLLLWMPEYAAMRRSGVPGVPQTHASAGLLAQRQMADAMPSCWQWRPL